MEILTDIQNKYEENECSCQVCKDMCSKWRPCWGTPEEIKQIMDAGFAGNLMLIYYCETGLNPVQILSPAIAGYENQFAPINPYGRCTFLDARDLCRLHDMGLKPLEGRVASCQDQKPAGIMQDIAREWDTPLGEELVEAWHGREKN